MMAIWQGLQGAVLPYLVDYAVVFLVGVLSWATSRLVTSLKTWFGLRLDEVQRAVVLGAVERGVHFAGDVVREHLRAKSSGVGFDVREKLIKAGVDYVETRVPEALAHFKLRPVDVGDMIAAKLEEKGIVGQLKNLGGIK